jgi:hypothetical protein
MTPTETPDNGEHGDEVDTGEWPVTEPAPAPAPDPEPDDDDAAG